MNLSRLVFAVFLLFLTACQPKSPFTQPSSAKTGGQELASSSLPSSSSIQATHSSSAEASSQASSKSQPESSQATTPSSSVETVVESSQATAPSSPVETVVESSQATTPSSSVERVVESSQATTPSSPVETVVESSQETAQFSNESLYASTLSLVAADSSLGRASHYAFYDVDGNGTAELITARGGANHLDMAAIYYLNQGVSTYLAQSYVAGGGGYRSTFVIYGDGLIEFDEWSSGSGEGTASLYQLAPDNSGHGLVAQIDFNMRESGNPDPLHFSGGRVALTVHDLNWIAF